MVASNGLYPNPKNPRMILRIKERGLIFGYSFTREQVHENHTIKDLFIVARYLE